MPRASSIRECTREMCARGNERSGRLLRRLGFVVEGYARDYLLIQGRWRDQVLVGLVNPEWQAPG